MSLADIVRSGVALADRISDSLQYQTVSHEAWTGSNGDGLPTYAAAVSRPGVVELEPTLVLHVEGEEIRPKAMVLFPRPIAANGATGRVEPIDPRDRITLPSGYRGPILRVTGTVDPSTGRPYAYEVALG